MNSPNLVIFLGWGHSIMYLFFSMSAFTPSWPMMCPRYKVYVKKNSHFDSLANKYWSCIIFNTTSRWCKCSFHVWLQIRMSSKKTSTYLEVSCGRYLSCMIGMWPEHLSSQRAWKQTQSDHNGIWKRALVCLPPSFEFDDNQF